jgi:hypothetical protein
MGLYPVVMLLQLDTTHKYHTSHKITYHPQTKQITQNYTNNEGHTTHKEYSANTITTTTNND